MAKMNGRTRAYPASRMAPLAVPMQKSAQQALFSGNRSRKIRLRMCINWLLDMGCLAITSNKEVMTDEAIAGVTMSDWKRPDSSTTSKSSSAMISWWPFTAKPQTGETKRARKRDSVQQKWAVSCGTVSAPNNSKKKKGQTKCCFI